MVLDSSVSLSWCFEDERTSATHAVLNQVQEDGATVPSLWRLEVANALQMALRRDRITAEFRDATLADLSALNITVDTETDDPAWAATLRLADRYRLTLYDAAYLELAQRLAQPLATLDQALRIGAAALGVPLLGLDTDALKSTRSS